MMHSLIAARCVACLGIAWAAQPPATVGWVILVVSMIVLSMAAYEEGRLKR